MQQIPQQDYTGVTDEVFAHDILLETEIIEEMQRLSMQFCNRPIDVVIEIPGGIINLTVYSPIQRH